MSLYPCLMGGALFGCLAAPVPWETGEFMVPGINYSELTPERAAAFQTMGLEVSIGGASGVAGWGTHTAGVGLLQALGLKVIGYSTPSTLYGDEIFDSLPESRNWLAVKPDGTPYVRDYEGAKRYQCCHNQPGWREYQRSVLRAFIEAGVIGVFWDDAFPANCYCRVCREKFREFLAARQEEPADPPVMESRLLDYRDVRNRLQLRWVQFQQEAVVDFILEMKAYARRLAPDFLVAMNTSQPGVTQCLDLSARTVDLFLYEEGPHTMAPASQNALRNLMAFARCRRKPPAMLLGRDDWGQTGATPLEYRVSIAESIASGAVFVLHCGHAGQQDETFRTHPENAETIGRYNRFLRAHAEYITGYRPAARVAFFDSAESARWDPQYYWRVKDVWRQLQFSGIPLGLVSSEDSLEHLGDFEVVIVPYAAVMTSGEAEALRSFARRGKMIVIGTPGVRDEEGQELGESRLADVLGFSASAAPPQRRRENLVYFRGLEEPPALQEALEGLIQPGDLRLRPPAGGRVYVNSWSRGRRTVVHLVNYAYTPETMSPVPAEGCRVTLARDGDWPRSARLLSPDHEPQELPLGATSDGRWVEIPIPAFEVWEMLVLE